MNKMLCALLCLGVATGAAAQATFHGDVTRSGHYAGAGPDKLNGIQWTFKAAGPIVASPAIADGVIYIGDYGGQFHAIDQATASRNGASNPACQSPRRRPSPGGSSISSPPPVRWLRSMRPRASRSGCLPTEYERRFEAPNLHGLQSAAQTIPDAWDVFMSSPAVADGRVYFGSGDGNVYALDASSGVIAMEVCDPGCRARLARGSRRHGVHRQLGRQFLRHRCRDRPAEMAVQGRTGPGHPQPGGIPVLGGGRRRHGVRRLPRCACLRAGCQDRPQEMGLPDQQVLGQRHACGR